MENKKSLANKLVKDFGGVRVASSERINVTHVPMTEIEEKTKGEEVYEAIMKYISEQDYVDMADRGNVRDYLGPSEMESIGLIRRDPNTVIVYQVVTGYDTPAQDNL